MGFSSHDPLVNKANPTNENAKRLISHQKDVKKATAVYSFSFGSVM
jgi:hypothetical protein